MRATKVFSIFSLCLIVIFGSAATLNSAAAQQQEKRVALVIGNGAYAKGPLATTANDAGLIAQNLQAAGFDVIGARDLDADSLRKTFRDFMQKVESDPGEHGRNGLSVRLRRAACRRELFHPGQFNDQSRHRYSDRGAAGQRLHARTRLRSVESQHLRARCRTAAALHRRRKPDCKRAGPGRSRAEHR